MKYIKYSIFTLLVCFGLSTIGTNAAQLYINSIKLPSLSRTYTTKEMTRSTNTGQQYVVKQECTDNWSGDDRAVSAKLNRTDGVNWSSSYEPLPTDSKVYYGTTSAVAGKYTVTLKATKSTASAATFIGYWHYG